MPLRTLPLQAARCFCSLPRKARRTCGRTRAPRHSGGVMSAPALSGVSIGDLFDEHCSDGTVRNRFLTIWSAASTALACIAALLPCALTVDFAGANVLSFPGDGTSGERLSYEIATQCTPPFRIDVVLSSETPSSNRERTNLLKAVVTMVRRLFEAEVGVHMLAGNMAHEIALLLSGTGIAIKTIEIELAALKEKALPSAELKTLEEAHQQVLIESRLGLYLVRNFLSASSSTKYSRVVPMRSQRFAIGDILNEMLELYKRMAVRRGIEIRQIEVGPLPELRGDPDEIRRALHNVLNNALKYSYRSGPSAERHIRIRTKVPYDPGFRKARFGIEISNYGLGVSDDEQRKVFQHGFRGYQAVQEVAPGSGIGLSEVQKIMSAHGGMAKFASKLVHETGDGEQTYLTTVTLILPYDR